MTIIPPFFSTTCIGLTQVLSKMGYMIPASNYLRISFIITSFILGFNFHYCLMLGLKLANSLDIINIITNYFLYVLSSLGNLFSCSTFKLTLIITRYVESGPRNAYFKEVRSNLSSTLGVSSAFSKEITCLQK